MHSRGEDSGLLPNLEVNYGLTDTLGLHFSAGPWSAFAEAGYDVNPGAGNRDWWFAGAALTREVRKTANSRPSSPTSSPSEPAGGPGRKSRHDRSFHPDGSFPARRLLK